MAVPGYRRNLEGTRGDWWSTNAPTPPSGGNLPPSSEGPGGMTGRGPFNPDGFAFNPRLFEPGDGMHLLGAPGQGAASAPRAGLPFGQGLPAPNWDNPTLQDLQNYFIARGVDPHEAPYWLAKWPELMARGRELGNPRYAVGRLAQAEVFGGGGGGGGAGAGGGGGSGIGASPGGPFSGIPPYQPPPFAPPTGLTYQNDPGFLERMRLGTRAIQESAAAKGSILSGGTLKALDRYAQDYASGEFGNVYGRALQTYGANIGAGQLGYENRYGQYTDYMRFQNELANRGLQAATRRYQPPGG